MTFPNQPQHFSKVSEMGKKSANAQAYKTKQNHKEITSPYCLCTQGVWETQEASLTLA